MSDANIMADVIGAFLRKQPPMKHVQRRHRSDANASEIIKVARALGVIVIPIGRPVDLLCGIESIWYAVEIKSEDGEYTKDQQEFFRLCAEAYLPVLTWRSAKDVMEACAR